MASAENLAPVNPENSEPLWQLDHSQFDDAAEQMQQLALPVGISYFEVAAI